ncbi:hypothetical protein Vafri_8026 [Volvox africanus]|uniref:Uncharacterized protein n=1 Tax=Volvox africanus TaxID=51714 RepID=A0A8J4B1A8_9CHLO|nr:hypothetical protein Vafri_8026 [Volvox africanus]
MFWKSGFSHLQCPGTDLPAPRQNRQVLRRRRVWSLLAVYEAHTAPHQVTGCAAERWRVQIRPSTAESKVGGQWKDAEGIGFLLREVIPTTGKLAELTRILHTTIAASPYKQLLNMLRSFAKLQAFVSHYYAHTTFDTVVLLPQSQMV